MNDVAEVNSDRQLIEFCIRRAPVDFDDRDCDTENQQKYSQPQALMAADPRDQLVVLECIREPGVYERAVG